MTEWNALTKVIEDPWDVFLKRLTYKPGWTFKHYYDYNIDRNRDRHQIKIEMVVEDTYHPGKMVPISMTKLVEPFDVFGEAVATEWILWMIEELEEHEMLEWFKKDGTVVKDPHANDQRPVGENGFG